MIAELLAGANVILAALAGVYSLLRWRQYPPQYRWVKALHAAVAFYWAGLYVFVVLTPSGIYDSVWFGQTFVRPAFTFTLGLMAAGAIQRYKAEK